MTSLLSRCLAGGALLALSLSSAPAGALKTGIYYRVTVDGHSSGSWYVRNRVEDTGFSCRYTFSWRGLCRIDEFKAGVDIDCEDARRRFFNTGITLADGTACRGEDEFGQRATVVQLDGGEVSSGRIYGVVQFAAVGDVLNLVVRPR